MGGQEFPLPCQAVLFDCDGVLVDSTRDGERAWTRWAQRYDLDPARVLDGVHGRRSRETVELFLPPPRRADALARIEALEIEGARQTPPMAGAHHLLNDPPMPWAIVTSASTQLVHARLHAAGLPLPPVLITGDDVDSGKPAPDGYLEAARRLGVPIAACLIAEDSAAGVRAGQAAGAAHVLGIGRPALQTTATTVVRDLSGLRWTSTALRMRAESLLRPLPGSPQQVGKHRRNTQER
ncbi:HAD-IA family hydrolase [Streptomyces brasiliensis]|uniref:HAD-IA family hydrolase n=1 Tax=Streptomyces brasiliensis TaxID=1954 RepID=UPI0016715267|nr:HAD-IA family hydrolase [Streptomyces brasiliensis]